MGVQIDVFRKGAEHTTGSQFDGGVLAAIQEALAVLGLQLPDDQVVKTLEACLAARFESAKAQPSSARYYWKYCGEEQPPYKWVCESATATEADDGEASPIVAMVTIDTPTN